MKKIKISEISDAVFIGFLTFFLAFIPVRFYLKKTLPSIIIAILISVIVLTLFILKTQRRHGALSIKKEDEERYEKCLNALAFMKKEETFDILTRLLDKENKRYSVQKNGITVDNDFLMPAFSYDATTRNQVIELYKNTPKSKSCVILSISFTDDALTLAKGFNGRIKLITLPQLYLIFKKYDCIPSSNFIPVIQKQKFSQMLKSTFDKKKTKTYAIYGLLLLAMSNFAFYPLWYIIVGCCFLFYSITIKFFQTDNTNVSDL